MISFFRRALSSWIVLALLGLILVAFLITGVNAPGGMGGGTGEGATAAKAGSIKISEGELARRARDQLESARREQPTLDAKAFLAAGGFERVTDVYIGMRAVEDWGRKQGFAIGKRLVDAEIAGFPAFQGVTGKFDEATMRAQLVAARINEKTFREGIASDLLRGQILSSVTAPTPMPLAMARAYASLRIEQRVGSVGIIPLGAVAVTTPPGEADVATAYRTNIAAYTRPELRVLRYALLGLDQVAAQSTPTEAEIVNYYKGNASTYAAKDVRDLTQVIVPSEAAAKAIAAAARRGGSLQAAAARAGLEASTLAKQVRADYAASSTEAVAAAAFAAPKGGVTNPVKGAFGWYVVRVDGVSGVGARTLDQARAEITATLAKQKAQEALADLSARIEDSIAEGASFEETVRANKLVMVETPPLLATGQSPADPAYKAPPEVAALLKSGFALSPDDKPTIETLIPDQRYALLGLGRVSPPTPLPLAQVREAVVRDLMIKRTAARAKAVADAIAAAVNRGVPLVKAMAGAGVALPPVQPATARQVDLERAQGPVPSPVRALFTLRAGRAIVVPADDGRAMFVTVLDRIVPTDVATVPGIVDQTRRDLARPLPDELVDEFGRAVEKEVKVQRNPDAIAAAKRQFAGQ